MKVAILRIFLYFFQKPAYRYVILRNINWRFGMYTLRVKQHVQN